MRWALLLAGLALTLGVTVAVVKTAVPVYLSMWANTSPTNGTIAYAFQGDGTNLFLLPDLSYTYDLSGATWVYIAVNYTVSANAPVAIYAATQDGKLAYITTAYTYTGTGFINVSNTGVKYSLPALSYRCVGCNGTLTLTYRVASSRAPRGLAVWYTVDIKYRVERR